jgi:large subunit ribosomal protein L15
MNLHDLYPFPEERANKKRIGRGRGTGQGCTAGKGNKGQNARAGAPTRPWFEGGQMPLARRLPKRGFKNPFREEYQAINLDDLMTAFPSATAISLEDIYDRGLAKRSALVKILGRGETRAVSVEAHRFSKSAEGKIAAAGGKVSAILIQAEG